MAYDQVSYLNSIRDACHSKCEQRVHAWEAGIPGHCSPTPMILKGMWCTGARMVVTSMRLGISDGRGVGSILKEYYLPQARPTDADGPASSAILSKNPTIYPPTLGERVHYKLPDNSDLHAMGLDCIYHKQMQWNKVAFSTSGELKYLPELTVQDANRSLTSATHQFSMTWLRERFQHARTYFSTRSLFNKRACADIHLFLSKWEGLFDAIMSIYDGELSITEKLPIIDSIFRQCDDAFRKVVSEQRMFSHDNYAGDASKFQQATMIVHLVLNRQELGAVLPLLGNSAKDLQSKVHGAISDRLQSDSTIKQIQHRLKQLDDQVASLKRKAPGGGGGGAGGGGGRFHERSTHHRNGGGGRYNERNNYNAPLPPPDIPKRHH
jgi:hypothetical protein